MRPPHPCHGHYHLFGDLVEQESLVKEPLISGEGVVSPGPPDEGVMSSFPSCSSDFHDLVAEDSKPIYSSGNGSSKLQVKFASVLRTLLTRCQQQAFTIYDISLSCYISVRSPNFSPSSNFNHFPVSLATSTCQLARFKVGLLMGLSFPSREFSRMKKRHYRWGLFAGTSNALLCN